MAKAPRSAYEKKVEVSCAAISPIGGSGITLRILSYNRRKFLEKALESAFSQTEPFDHVELYDNGSNFSVGDLHSLFPSLRIFGLPRSVPAAENIRRAFVDPPSTPILCVFHDDDLLLPHFHATVKAALSMHPKVGAVSCNGRVIDNQGQAHGALLPNLKKDLLLGGASDFAGWYCEGFIPFPTTVYRWSKKFGEDLDFARSFGRCADVAFLSCVVQRAPILLLAKECFSYRRHGGQDSAGFKWWEETKRWELQLQLCSGDPGARRHVKKKRNARMTSRWLNAWLQAEPREEDWDWQFFSLASAQRFFRNNKLRILLRLMKAGAKQ